MQENYYAVTIGSITRHLPICPINEEVAIAVFNILGDVEVTIAAAKALLAIAPDFDVLVTAEAKSIPLIYEMARIAKKSRYIVARKSEKNYTKSRFSINVHSITTTVPQHLFLSEQDAALIRQQRIVIVDDVISSRHTLDALTHLVHLAKGDIVGNMAVFAEGDANQHNDILCLGHLPLFSVKT